MKDVLRFCRLCKKADGLKFLVRQADSVILDESGYRAYKLLPGQTPCRFGAGEESDAAAEVIRGIRVREICSSGIQKKPDG